MSFIRPHSAGCIVVVLAFLLHAPGSLCAQTPLEGHSMASSAARDASQYPLEIQSQFAFRFQDGEETVLLLRGDCQIRQAGQRWSAPLMILWEVSTPDASRKKVLAYVEGSLEEPAVAVGPRENLTRPYLFANLETLSEIRLTGRPPEEHPSGEQDPAYRRACSRRHASPGVVQQAQYLPPAPEAQQPLLAPVPSIGMQRRVTIGPRFLGERLEINSGEIEGSIPPEWVMTITGGVNIVVTNVPLQVNGQTVLTSIDLTADRAVVWTDANYFGGASSFEIGENAPFQVYLEGNIIVRQGTSVVQSTHAFYDVNRRRGLAMNAELRTLLPDYQGTLRLRAAEVRQYSETSFHARNAWFTTSEFGKPKYRIQASDIFLEERIRPNPTSIDSATGQPDNSTLHVTSLNNVLFAENMPLFAVPYLSGAAEDPKIPIRKLNVGYSGMFGWEVETEWALDSLLGWELSPGTDLTLQADFLSDRGPALGLRGEYDTFGSIFGVPAHSVGNGHVYYINDHGKDNLGLGRRSLAVPDDNRGRVLLRNQSEFDPFTKLHAEIGYIYDNDRNFMEQYFENEWDSDKDLENLLFLNHQYDNLTASLMGRVQTNDFETTTNWLPRADLTILGEPLLQSPLLWSSHSQIGYGHIRPADAPPDPVADPFMPLPYYTDVSGLVAMSRHELSLPMNLGPVHVAPYVLGEVAHWQEDMFGDDLTRWYGSAGVRASVQFAKYMPHVQSQILGLNGLAHKVTFDADYYIADSSADLSRVPQYNEFDEDAQERFRTRFLPLEFGGVLPAQYDPRYYAVRSGAGRSVTAPYYELVDDQQTLWLGMRNRWQTKVGPPDAQRIIDWMELDLGLGIFPNADDDNFGETLGLITGRYAWHVGPRTSILANGVFDVFDMGQKVWNVGILNQRSARGSLYVGFRDVQAGPIDSQLITSSFSYVMSPNLYVATLGASFDIAEGQDRGESLTITRIGESFLLHFGLGYDRSRDNVGVALSLEPKFGSFGSNSMQLNSLLGID